MRLQRKKIRIIKGSFDKTFESVCKKRNLPTDFSVSRDLVRKRVERGSTVVLNENGSGQVSPLLDA